MSGVSHEGRVVLVKLCNRDMSTRVWDTPSGPASKAVGVDPRTRPSKGPLIVTRPQLPLLLAPGGLARDGCLPIPGHVVTGCFSRNDWRQSIDVRLSTARPRAALIFSARPSFSVVRLCVRRASADPQKPVGRLNRGNGCISHPMLTASRHELMVRGSRADADHRPLTSRGCRMQDPTSTGFSG